MLKDNACTMHNKRVVREQQFVMEGGGVCVKMLCRSGEGSKGDVTSLPQPISHLIIVIDIEIYKPGTFLTTTDPNCTFDAIYFRILTQLVNDRLKPGGSSFLSPHPFTPYPVSLTSYFTYGE